MTFLTFGWRALLKIKHVPEQLFDVTLFPVMMTLILTYQFGGAIAGSTQDHIAYLAPGVLVRSVLFITMHTIAALVTGTVCWLVGWRPAALVGVFGSLTMWKYRDPR